MLSVKGNEYCLLVNNPKNVELGIDCVPLTLISVADVQIGVIHINLSGIVSVVLLVRIAREPLVVVALV